MSYEIKVGDKIPDGLGVEHTVISTDGIHGRPVVTKSFVPYGIEVLRSFTIKGEAGGAISPDCNLILPKRTRTMQLYINIYKDKEYVYDSQLEAQEEHACDALAVAVPVSFEVEW